MVGLLKRMLLPNLARALAKGTVMSCFLFPFLVWWGRTRGVLRYDLDGGVPLEPCNPCTHFKGKFAFGKKMYPILGLALGVFSKCRPTFHNFQKI